ncbi:MULTISPECIES: flagellar hook-basal body complex protein FliE [unclassified Novosphingobium]|uniref:flagellar hook-basal body complex protein FliE n=1 Tax=unclassified Novosphingobium TaxID=2644732 RepID=UPI000ECE4DC3|nr:MULTISPECIES: flagellar hook-basal body complex protein FliE [unclassified Novosphingobium]HCF24406.1 flagellar hook-basal body complex protein FliE [Novosphingobium sp.]HQV03787.1 flagellar hook-basal body complex protein FliE [Novosphingobium sp.]
MSGIGGIGGGGGIQQILQMRQQILDRNALLKDVHSAAQASGSVEETTASPAGTFTDALKSALDGVTATQRNAEGLSAAYERGDVTDIAKVMLARQEAGIAFEATLQVRNRLLSAYQDIMRMGV